MGSHRYPEVEVSEEDEDGEEKKEQKEGITLESYKNLQIGIAVHYKEHERCLTNPDGCYFTKYLGTSTSSKLGADSK